jgi:hypothetical protein
VGSSCVHPVHPVLHVCALWTIAMCPGSPGAGKAWAAGVLEPSAPAVRSPSRARARTCGLTALLNQVRHKLLCIIPAHSPGLRIPTGLLCTRTSPASARFNRAPASHTVSFRSVDPSRTASYQKPWKTNGLHDRTAAALPQVPWYFAGLISPRGSTRLFHNQLSTRRYLSNL